MAATLNAVSDFISKVGFPIAVAGFVLWQYFNMHRENGARLGRMEILLSGILDELRGRDRNAGWDRPGDQRKTEVS
jgi:hypothetical protein